MAHLALLYVHVLGAVFLCGHALFGAILSLGGAEPELAERAQRLEWPPRGLPSPVRLRVVGLGWGALAVTAGSGALLLAQSAAPLSAYAVKLGLVALLFGAQLVLTARPRGAVPVAHLAAALAVVAVSAMLSR